LEFGQTYGIVEKAYHATRDQNFKLKGVKVLEILQDKDQPTRQSTNQVFNAMLT
jgi:hypothetical protein